MTLRPARRLLAFLALVLSARASRAAPPPGPPADHPCLLEDARFEPVHSEDGVDVGQATLDGGAVVLRARAAFDAPPARVAALLEEIDRWPSWIRRLRSLDRLPGSPPAFHAVLRLPWPLRDRDYAFSPSIVRDADRTVLFWDDAAERLPAAAPGRVRAGPVRGCFTVAPARGAAVTYTELDSFGESLPSWLRRSARRRGPVRVLAGLRAMLRE